MNAAGLDRDVEARLRASDPRGAAAVVVRTLGAELLGYLRAVLRDVDDADEVFAQTAEIVVARIAAFRGESSVKTWLYRIAWRTAMHHRRGPRARRGRRLASAEAEALVAEVRSSTAPHRRTAAKDWLARVREELSPEDQSLLTLRLDRDLSWSEVAHVMGAGETAVEVARLRKRFERIKARLREAAGRDGWRDSARDEGER